MKGARIGLTSAAPEARRQRRDAFEDDTWPHSRARAKAKQTKPDIPTRRESDHLPHTYLFERSYLRMYTSGKQRHNQEKGRQSRETDFTEGQESEVLG